MTYRLAAGSFAALALLVLAPTARAQVGPSPMPGAGGGSEEQQKPEGVAEEAPKTPGLLPTTPTLPPPKGKRNKFQLFELGGYFRFRGEYRKNFNLGFVDDPSLDPSVGAGGAPFPRNLACNKPTAGSVGDLPDRPCEDSQKDANIRLRLEPKINVNESTAVYAQIDVLDNQVLGATPAGDLNGNGVQGVNGIGDGQVPPQQGVNWSTESIRVKRAWAEITTPLGMIKVGRQPSDWGMGIFQNGGGENPIDGGYNYMGDYGDTVDRLMLSTMVPGTKLRAAVAADWPRTGLTSSQSNLKGGLTYGGQGWDLDDNDDVNQWVVVLSKLDTPTDFRDAIDRGEMSLDYGVYFAYRTQGWDYTSTAAIGSAYEPDKLVKRDLTEYVPDAWVKLGWHQLELEAEAVTSIGTINNMTDFNIKGPVKIRQWGGVGRLTYRAVQDKLKVGLEVGGASGGNNDNSPQGDISITHAQPLPLKSGDDTISWFRLDPDYRVDMILFRQLIGAVSNAIYAKPFMSYDLTKSIAVKVANITSFAVKPVATPGNDVPYGTEFDADIGYSTPTFDAGITYGVLFPLGALSHPQDIAGQGGPGFGYGSANVGDATTAHTLEGRIIVKF